MTALANITQLPANTQAPREGGQQVRTLSPWRGVLPTTMDEGMRLAKAIAASGFAPKSYYPNDPDPDARLRGATAAVFAAVQLGAEVGLSPMSAVQNIALINGRPGLFGPAMLAVVRKSGLLADIDEGVRGSADQTEGFCTVTRVGERPRTYIFSWAQAKKAGLIGKAGPWTQYPDRMLLARAQDVCAEGCFSRRAAGPEPERGRASGLHDHRRNRQPAPAAGPRAGTEGRPDRSYTARRHGPGLFSADETGPG